MCGSYVQHLPPRPNRSPSRSPSTGREESLYCSCDGHHLLYILLMCRVFQIMFLWSGLCIPNREGGGNGLEFERQTASEIYSRWSSHRTLNVAEMLFLQSRHGECLGLSVFNSLSYSVWFSGIEFFFDLVVV
ncbi:hypothetical protein BO82DRAFT_214368 [Aspergillus uvarum CBS 121591]|uniref:Uncharacterized protein n=1 Tax=Aspergillus uvarum CBS 121591 TaxID=1448315 RepID=A0A319BRN9_9EURO|nr:hypothetical protein BO82DRAFT_214368 [Aspergillus uvarum CBS 121591]PYH76206.1 hypothetical protein BO82DRAFT_214368 [Aspergillus uvarum CBS 121591]